MATRDLLARAVSDAAGTVAEREGLAVTTDPASVHLERPARRDNGDWSTTFALATAKQAGTSSKALAESLVEALRADPPPHTTAIEIAGPGFINFRLDEGWLHDALSDVLAEGEEGYARPDVGHGERVQIEFISANPTGPIHVGNGWWGSYGDALARVLARSGYQVSREYYVNDTGGQIRALGESLLARRRGDPVPEDGYQGEYVTELAAAYDGADEVTEAGRWAADLDPRAHPLVARLGRHPLRRVVQPSFHRGERGSGRDHRAAGCQGPGLRARRGHLVPGDGLGGQP